MKNCIFHIPYQIDGVGDSGSSLRPIKMIEAFRENGYNVLVVKGNIKERRDSIQEIKRNIKNGMKIDFVYSESSNMPTLLVDKINALRSPFIDFRFLAYCKRKGIKIGLFYRDIHWKFEHFKAEKGNLKVSIGKIFYKIDLLFYKKIITNFYVPNKAFLDYIPYKMQMKIGELPPGCIKVSMDLEKSQHINNNGILNIFYVGGLGKLYRLNNLMKVVKKSSKIKLTICCREKEWFKEKENYRAYMCDNIAIVHGNSKELIKYYNEADVVSLIVEPSEYWKIALPIKLFEYISYKKPVLGVKNTAVGEYIENNQIGWTCDYSVEEIEKLLNHVYNEKMFKDNSNMTENIQKVINNNTWENRALLVINDLIK